MPVSLTFEQQTLFNTGIGGIFSVICGIIILVYIIDRSISMLPASFGTQTSMIERSHDRNVAFDLAELNFIFGIEDIDPKLGRIEVYAVSKPKPRVKDSQLLEMVKCKDLIDSNDGKHSEIYS